MLTATRRENTIRGARTGAATRSAGGGHLKAAVGRRAALFITPVCLQNKQQARGCHPPPRISPTNVAGRTLL